MAEQREGWTLGRLAELLGAELTGSPEIVVLRPGPSDTADPAALTFAADAKNIEFAAASAAAAVLVAPGVTMDKATLTVASPRMAFGKFLAMCVRPLRSEIGVHPTAIVHPTAVVDPTAHIGPYVVIEADSIVGPGVRIFPFAFVGDGCVIEAEATIYPHVVLVQDVYIGRRSIIHAGAILGADGFGFFWDGAQHQKIPQVGGVRIGANAEIGAVTTVDRATAGETTIGDGTKIDNLVQIAHNVRVGRHLVIAAQAGIGGSANVGDRTMMGGRAAISDHVTIGPDSILLGRASAITDLPGGAMYLGYPAVPVMEENRMRASLRKLPELLKRVKALESKLRTIEEAEA